MKKFLTLACVFTALTYNTANAQYYNYEAIKYTNPSQQYHKLTNEEEKNFHDRKITKNNTNYGLKTYIGLDVGTSSTKFGDNKLINDDTMSDHNLALGFNVGARFKYIGVEAYYQMSDKGTVNRGNLKNDGYTSRSTIDFSSYGADLMGYIPIKQDLEILASLGLAKYDFDTTSKRVDAVYDEEKDETHYIKSVVTKGFKTNAVRFGIGAQYAVYENVSLRIMANYIQMDDDDYVKDMMELSMGIRYTF